MMDQEDQLYETADRYKQKFGDTPTISNLEPSLLQKANQLLDNALKTGRAFKDDKEWWRALGVPPPPDDALV